MKNGKKKIKILSKSIVFSFRNGQKCAKGVSTYTKTELSHNQCKQTLTYCSLVRSEKVRISSCNRNLQTIITNKTTCPFGHKRLLKDKFTKVTTSPFGHKRLLKDKFKKVIGRTIDRGKNDVDVVITPTDNGREGVTEAIVAQGGYKVDLFTPPDMGFKQPTYTVQGLEQDFAGRFRPTNWAN